MNKVDKIMLERSINKAKNKNNAIKYGEGFNEEVNSYKRMKNDKRIDSAKRELSLENKF